MSIIKRVTHPASLSFVNLILALGSVPTVALSSSTRKSRIMIPVGICSCQCTISPEWVINLGGITDQFARNKCSTSPVSLSTKNGIFIGKDKIPWQYGKDHSCYPYYSLFVSSAHAEILRSCAPGTTMNSGTAKRINRDCGFTRSRKRALWYCPECVKEDFSLYGETCWRRLPQLPGAVYCPVHRVKLRESGVRVQDIQYQIVPATYALIHVPEPEPEAGNVYSERYIQLAEDMAWILANGFSLHGFDWIRANYYGATGRTIRQHLFYGITEREHRGNQFEDYLASKIMKDTAKERIDPFASRQLGTILSLEDKFGTVENFYNEHGEE